MKKLAVFCVSVTIALMIAVPVAAQTNVKLVLDWAFQGIHGLYTLADDNGHFEREGLKVKIDRGYGSGDTINKVAAGTYDIGVADINVLLQFNAKNPNNKVVSFYVVFDRTLLSIVALKKSGIKNPKDLKGRTIAGPPWDSARILFPTFAAANDIDQGSIKWLSAKPHIKDGLLVRGETDAVVAFPSTTLMVLESQGIPIKDAIVFRYADYGLDLYGNGLVTSAKFAAKNPNVLKAFVRAMIKGTRDALADPKKAVASAKKRDNLMREDIELKRFAMIRDQSILSPSIKANGFSHVDNARLVRTLGYVAKAMKIQNAPKPKEVFNGDFLPPADQRKP